MFQPVKKALPKEEKIKVLRKKKVVVLENDFVDKVLASQVNLSLKELMKVNLTSLYAALRSFKTKTKQPRPKKSLLDIYDPFKEFPN